MPSNVKRNLWMAGKELAMNPGIFKRINHSKMAHSSGIGQGKWRDGGFLIKLGKKGIKTGLSFIPIPVVKDLVTGAFDIGAQKAREQYLKHNNKLAEKIGTVEEQVKWSLKSASVEDWDRYRRKIAHAYEELHRVVELLEAPMTLSTSACNDAVHACYKYAYLQKRMNKMEMELQSFEDLITKTRQWIDEVRTKVEQADYFDRINFYVDLAYEEEPTLHKDCDSDKCAFSDKQRFWKSHPTLYKGLVTAGRVVQEVAPLGDSFLGKDGFSGSGYQAG